MKQKLLLSLALTLGLASSTWAENGVLTTTTINSKTYYQIEDAADLQAFANKVNTDREMSANAVLTNNIDMSGVSSWEPIGNWVNSCAYKGHFDGQGHKIENVNITSFSRSYHGLFGIISTGCLIENFSIYGEMTFGVQNAGTIAAYARDATPTIRDVHSFVTIKDSQTNQNRHHAGIVGTVQKGTSAGGTTVIERCSYSGTLSVSTTNNNANYGGIVGFVQSDTTAVCNITDCLFDGTLENTSSTPGSCSFGGIVGYCSSGKTTITNCLSVGTVSAKAGRFGQLFGIANSDTSSTKIYNSYYVGANANGTESKTPTPNEATLVTAAQLPSGEVAYLLNESTNGGTSWRQTLSADTKPTLDSTHGRVYLIGTKCPDGTLHDDVEYSNTAGTLTEDHNYVDGICSYCKDFDLTFVSKDSEGYYEIGTPAQLKWFSAFVNDNHLDSNAKLTADIDMNGADVSHFPIGTRANPYKGTFDGKGHKISNLQLINDSAPTSYGMFNTGANVTLKNFWLDSSCVIQGTEEVGLVGRHSGGGGRFEGLGNCGNVTGSNRRDGGIIGAAWGGDQTITIKNCWTTGTITGGAVNAGGAAAIIAWFNSATMVMENCWTIAEVSGATSKAKYVYDNGATNTSASTFTNCYSKNGAQPTFSNTISNEQLTSGELCYMLNGSTNGGTDWYQTIGTDNNPYPYSSGHGQVYKNGTFCRDTNFPQGVYSYGNADEVVTGDHAWDEGICSYCGYPKEDYISVNDEGFYEIATPTQFKWFAAYVNCIDPNVNAKLTANIDLNNVTWTPIGNASNKYTGTFDGCGYTISNLTTEPCVYNGLFGYINGATVQNFYINGSIETLTSGTMNYIGVIGMSEKKSHISGIHSSLNIKVRCESDAGGVLGSGGSVSSEDKLFINCCSFSGKLTIDNGVAKDQFGGIVGYTASATITNCLFNGTLSGNASNRGFGGILGYTNVYIGGVQNCLSIGNFSGTGGRYGTIIGNYNSTTDRKDRVKNNYYLSGSIAGAGNNPDKIEATGISAEQLASGELCYLLNGSSCYDATWRQNIGKDKDTYPELDPTHGIVNKITAAGYTTQYTHDTDVTIPSGIKAYAGIVDDEKLRLVAIENAISKDDAVILKGSEGYYSFMPTMGVSRAATNDLLGSDGNVYGGEGIYALANIGGVGFYPVTDTDIKIPAGKAYLDLTESSVKEFLTFVFDDDDPTGINEELRMMNEESISLFNLAGQRLSKMQKGINIVNGKKVLK